MSKAIENYYVALRHLEVNGKKRISRRSVAIEAGNDPSSIKNGRSSAMDKLIKDIENAESRRKKKEMPLAREKRIKEDYKVKVKELKTLLKDAYAREVNLIRRIDSMEKELVEIKRKNPMRIV